MATIFCVRLIPVDTQSWMRNGGTSQKYRGGGEGHRETLAGLSGPLLEAAGTKNDGRSSHLQAAADSLTTPDYYYHITPATLLAQF
jgi:hypothetical protein